MRPMEIQSGAGWLVGVGWPRRWPSARSACTAERSGLRSLCNMQIVDLLVKIFIPLIQSLMPVFTTVFGVIVDVIQNILPPIMIVDTVGATGIIAGDWMYVAYAATAAGVPTPFSDATKWEVVLPLTQNGTGYWGIWRHKWLTTDVQDIIITPTATQTFSALGFWVRGTDKPPTVGTPATFVANEALVAPSITPLNAGRRITLAFGQVTSSKGVADVKNATTLTNAPPVNSNSSVKLVLTDDAMAGAAATPDVTVTWPQTGALAGRKYDLTFNRTYAYDANYVAGSAVQIGFMTRCSRRASLTHLDLVR